MGKKANERRRSIVEEVKRMDAEKRIQAHVEELRFRNYERSATRAENRKQPRQKPHGLCCVHGRSEEQMPSYFRPCPDCPLTKEPAPDTV